MRMVHSARMLGLVMAVVVLALALAVAGCGGSDAGTTTSAAPATTTPIPNPPATTDGTESSTPVSLSGDEATIAANWTTFFDGSQPVTGKADLLQNGDQYAAELEAQAASPLTKGVTVEVSAVTIGSDSTAEVTYSLLLGGIPALADQKGQAILEDGVWKVGEASFQALLALQGAGTTPTTAQ